MCSRDSLYQRSPMQAVREMLVRTIFLSLVFSLYSLAQAQTASITAKNAKDHLGSESYYPNNLHVGGGTFGGSTATFNPNAFSTTYPNDVNFGSGVPWFDVKAFCASGSQTTTTGTITGSTTTLTLASAIDFTTCPSPAPTGAPTGQGVTIYHAGAAPTISAPTGIAVTQGGTPGSTSYGYQIVANDYAGGATAATTTVATTKGNATLSTTNYNVVCFTPSAGAASYSIYRGGAYLVTTFDSTPPSVSYCYWDTGYNENGQGWGNSTTTKPDWLPSTPGAAVNDWCRTTIARGAGTTSLTLSALCPNAASGQIVKHDDTPAIQAAVNACNTAAGGTVYFPVRGNFNVGYINFPPSSPSRGWIILHIDGQLSLTYPITFGTPLTYGQQNKIRITGGTGGSSASSQFPPSNVGLINSGFVSPVIHIMYQNGASLAPFVFDHIGIYNRGIGGGDGIVNDGGNSGGLYISNVDVATTGTALKIGYGGYGGGANGPCTAGGGFGAYVDHSTFTSYFAGDPLTNCDGWTIDITFGLAYFDTITLVGQGIHTMGMGTTDWNKIYEESGTTTGFLTWDTRGGTCNPQCGSNSFRHVELADAIGGGNTYFINTVNGTSTPLGIYADFDSVEGVGSLVGGTTPIGGCVLNQNGTILADTIPGECSRSGGTINGALTGTGGKSGINMRANMTSSSGLNAANSWNLGNVSTSGGMLAMEAGSGFTGNYLTIFDPSSTVSSNTINASIDASYNFNTIGAFKSTMATGTAPMTVASTTPVAKFTAQYAQSTQYSGTTSRIGGGPLGAGICTTGSVVITGAATTMTVAVSPAADPGTGFIWEGFVSASNTITVRLCNITSGALTPASTTYNVRVIQ